ncbi:unnamed protein product [Ostreobium quekettii]|uniref:protein-tyrosine-phosphatase n=1 Tax=Ostreobium quekettii TaxID=121088 RepID=A0A8S1IWA5_9CHLO|nr:unnamed protein product [Ostreobium quekettii]
MDVSRAVVNPVFRSAPWDQENREKDGMVRILFVSESNVCRSVLAEAIFTQLVEEMGMGNLLTCDSKGSRDYNLGEGPEASVLQAAEDLGIVLPEGFQARMVDHARDIVIYDLLLAMDKFTSADVLREVSVYDTIAREGGYSMKVRRLGEFHPVLAKSLDSEGQDIDDPLYGNVGGSEEVEAVKKAARIIEAACLGLMQFFQDLQEQAGDDPAKFKSLVLESVRGMKEMDWLVPPMLQKKK